MKKTRKQAQNSKKSANKAQVAKTNSPIEAKTPPRPKRILWASVSALLDTSSGCAMSMRELLKYLVKKGYEVFILTGTIFDSEMGLNRIAEYWPKIQEKVGGVVKFIDGNLEHHLVPTKTINRYQLNAVEEANYFANYVKVLNSFKPDLVMTYGGYLLDFCMTDEACDRHIPIVAYLGNSQYQDARWCRDIDLILTNSKAAANMYIEKQGFKPVPIGVTIDTERVLAEQHERKHVLFVNPSLPKGVTIAIMCALILEQKRQDIKFEIVESRGNWNEVLKLTTQALGYPRTSLNNVIVTPNTTDMRPVYSRARLTLMPSLCFEMLGRVAVESLLNGIPVIASNRGGLPEVVQDGGITVNFPEECYVEPYNRTMKLETLLPLTNFIEKCYDDPAFYNSYVEKAQNVGKHYAPEITVNNFLKVVQPLLDQKAGSRSLTAARRNKHKQI